MRVCVLHRHSVHIWMVASKKVEKNKLEEAEEKEENRMEMLQDKSWLKRYDIK